MQEIQREDLNRRAAILDDADAFEKKIDDFLKYNPEGGKFFLSNQLPLLIGLMIITFQEKGWEVYYCDSIDGDEIIEEEEFLEFRKK